MKRLSQFAERIKAQEAEHAARMESDPVYRAEVEAREAETNSRHAGYEVLRREEQYRVLGLPDRLAGILAGPEPLLDTAGVRAVEKWLGDDVPFLVLGGNVGTGKTVAGAYALSKRGGLFRKASQITRMSQYDSEAWGGLYRAGLLVVDDLGTEPLDQGGWGMSALLDLFDRRYDERARTLITTNLTADALRTRYSSDGGRFADRLRETARWINFAGASLRVRPPEAA